MRLAKLPVTGNLEDEWRRIQGNAPDPGADPDGPDPGPPEDLFAAAADEPGPAPDESARRLACPRCGQDYLDPPGHICPAQGRAAHRAAPLSDNGLSPHPAPRRGPVMPTAAVRPWSRPATPAPAAPAEPTTALPGSEEKIRVLAERFARGEDLWHPDDARGARDDAAGLAQLARLLGPAAETEGEAEEVEAVDGVGPGPGGTEEDARDRIHERLLARSRLDPETGCYTWHGTVQRRTGIGLLRVFGRQRTVQRAAAWAYGLLADLRDGTRVASATCGNRRCVNFEHLAVVVRADHNRQKAARLNARRPARPAGRLPPAPRPVEDRPCPDVGPRAAAVDRVLAAAWAALKPLLPPVTWAPGFGTRPWSNLAVLHTLVYRRVNRVPWARMPAGFVGRTQAKRRLEFWRALDGFAAAWDRLAEDHPELRGA